MWRVQLCRWAKVTDSSFMALLSVKTTIGGLLYVATMLNLICVYALFLLLCVVTTT